MACRRASDGVGSADVTSIYPLTGGVMEIRCKKGNCKHNTGCSCSAKDVEISRGTECNSFVKDEIKDDLMIENGNIFEVAEELVPKNLKNVPLECRARNCLYNRQDMCHANGITVINTDDESDEEADCATFCEK